MPVNSVQADMILIFFAIAPYARTHTHTHTHTRYIDGTNKYLVNEY